MKSTRDPPDPKPLNPTPLKPKPLNPKRLLEPFKGTLVIAFKGTLKASNLHHTTSGNPLSGQLEGPVLECKEKICEALGATGRGF